MTAYNFSQLIDFTRTSSATYVDSTGKIVSTPTSRNLLLFTQDFNNAYWTKTNSSVSANVTTAPDGTPTADKLVENTAASTNHFMDGGANVVGIPIVYSVYAKAAGRSFLQLTGGGFGAQGNTAIFNLSNGTMFTNTGNKGGIVDAGNGWYRCYIAFTPSTTGSIGVYMCDNAGNPSYTGDGVSGVFFWGAQLEQASAATTYTRNYGGLFPPRFDYDPVTLAPKGLLIEEQRTNLLTYSQDMTNATWSAINGTKATSSVVGPDGVTNLAQFTATAAGGNRLQASGISVTSGTTYTISVVMAAGSSTFGGLVAAASANAGAIFNLSGNGAVVSTAGAGVAATIQKLSATLFRCTMTFAATATGSVNIGWGVSDGSTYASTIYPSASSGFIYGSFVQIEAGAFATSYIPTVASQVTRTADVATISAPNFAPWYNQSEGTFVFEGSSVAPSTLAQTITALAASDGTNNNITRIARYLDFWANDTRTGNVLQAQLYAAGTYTPNATAKVAYAYKTNDFAASFNGATALTDTSGTVPTVVNNLAIGNSPGNFLNGHIRSIKYFPTRLSNSQLQALTA